jgi:tetratricopeptide (TPR) repeat protein
VAKLLSTHMDDWNNVLGETCDGTAPTDMRARGIACLHRRLDEVDAAVGVLTDADTGIIESSVEVASALEPARRCVGARTDPPATEDELEAAADLDRAEALLRAGRPDEAREAADAVLQSIQALDAVHLETRAHMVRGQAACTLQNLPEGMADLRRAVILADRSDSARLAVHAMLALLSFSSRAQPGGEAELLAGLCEGRIAGAQGEADHFQWSLHYEHGVLRGEQRRFDEARALLERARRELLVLPGEHDVERSNVENELGSIAGRVGDSAAARRHFEASLAIEQALRGPWHPRVMAVTTNLGLTAWVAGDVPRARELLDRVVEIAERTDGSDGRSLAAALASQALVDLATGRWQAAREGLERALPIRERVLGPEHISTGGTLINLALAHAPLGDLDAADAASARALRILEAGLPPDHPDALEARGLRGEILRARGDAAAADTMLRQALADLERTLGADDPRLCFVLLSLARLHEARGETTKAVAMLTRAVGLGETPFTVHTRAHAQVELARLVVADDRDRARALAEEARETYRRLQWQGEEAARVERFLAEHRR